MAETGPSFTEDQEAHWIAEQQAARSAADEAERRRTEESRRIEGETPSPGIAAPTAAAGGAIAGGTVGTLILGPIGTAIGALTGAAAGAAAASGAAASEDASRAHSWDPDADVGYRTHYESSQHRLADRPYENVRPAYQFGHVLARHPRFRDRPFDEVEPEFRSVWGDEMVREYGAWDAMRHFTRYGYEESRARNRGEVPRDQVVASDTHGLAPFADPIPRYTDPAPSSTGQDVAGSRHTEGETVRDLDLDAGSRDHRR
jgi:hypothetical protein